MKSITFNFFYLTVLLLISIFFISCPAIYYEKKVDKEAPVIKTSASLTYTGANDQIFHIDNENATIVDLTIDLGNNTRSIYYVFTNTDFNTNYINPSVSSGSYDFTLLNSIKTGLSLSKNSSSQSNTPIIYDNPDVQKFNENTSQYLKNKKDSLKFLTDKLSVPTPSFDMVDNTTDFIYDTSANKVLATCRKVVTKVNTIYGVKTLNIWVADDCWIDIGTKSYLVDQEKIDILTDKFLKDGLNNDVYDWITNIFGKEWGTHSFPYDLISANDEITIFLYDIKNDDNIFLNGSPAYAGIFYAKDNFLKSAVKYSNERIMFYLDAVMFACYLDSGWDMQDKWPQAIISTLAHEFQHMIHFYQKAILRGADLTGETWLNEMCSMAAEDLIADKLQVNGPRGVLYSDSSAGIENNNSGRLPLYNWYNDESVNNWQSGDDVLISYAINYAFGAYLARNFKGAELFQYIVQNPYTDENAITYALEKIGSTESITTALQKWGAANLVSDNITPPEVYYKYNQGSNWFTSTIGDVTYNLGSINLYNYQYESQIGPYIYNFSPVGSPIHVGSPSYSYLFYASNRYYLAGENKTGIMTDRIDLINPSVKLTVVIK